MVSIVEREADGWSVIQNAVKQAFHGEVMMVNGRLSNEKNVAVRYQNGRFMVFRFSMFENEEDYEVAVFDGLPGPNSQPQMVLANTVEGYPFLFRHVAYSISRAVQLPDGFVVFIDVGFRAGEGRPETMTDWFSSDGRFVKRTKGIDLIPCMNCDSVFTIQESPDGEEVLVPLGMD